MSASPAHLDLGLADAHRLEQHRVEAGRVEHPQGLRGGGRQPAEMSAGGHRPDVDPRIQRVTLHPHPIAEQGAAGERRARVDGQHPDPLAVRPQRADQGRVVVDLPTPGDPVSPITWARPVSGASARARAGSGGRTVLDQADHPADRPRLARADRREQGGQIWIGSSGSFGGPRWSAGLRRHGRGVRISASPWPPPPHRAATPMPPPRRRSAYARVSTSRAPGGADRMAQRDGAAVDVHPLVGLCRAEPQRPGTGHADRRERLVDLDQVQVGDRDLLLAGTPPRSRWPAAAAARSPVRPPCAWAPISASGVRPSRSAASWLATTSAAAPSEIGLDEPAVIDPVLAECRR